CTETYTILAGDTCEKIEAKTGISDADLHALNPAVNSGCTNLVIGKALCLNDGSGGGGCSKTYTVVKGDTCETIESKTGVSDAQLHQLNPAINSACTSLEIGQALCVSGGSGGGGGGGCSKTYTVVKGDTCEVIEAKTGISDAQLHQQNPTINSACTSGLPCLSLLINGC
ncbi:hypothetical protein C8J57DRAFT_1086591, partial [Mycena rebaudengoi]